MLKKLFEQEDEFFKVKQRFKACFKRGLTDCQIIDAEVTIAMLSTHEHCGIRDGTEAFIVEMLLSLFTPMLFELDLAPFKKNVLMKTE